MKKSQVIKALSVFLITAMLACSLAGCGSLSARTEDAAESSHSDPAVPADPAGDLSEPEPAGSDGLSEVDSMAEADALYEAGSMNETTMYEAQASEVLSDSSAASCDEPYGPGVTGTVGGEEDRYPEPDPFNTEEYNYTPENRFLSVKANPLSTFAADVDTASYANVRRFLVNGQAVPADAVRLEEMINYFEYDYPEPEGRDPFSVTTEIAPCPWNSETELLLIGLQAKKPDADRMPPSNLVFLIDTSGSMDEPNKLPLVQRAFLTLTETLSDNDTVSIVTYASSEEVKLDGASGADKAVIMGAIEDLSAYGGTYGEGGIRMAYDLAERHFIKGGNNRIILATDGDLNIGINSEGELTRLVKEKAAGGVALTALGFGYGNYKDNKLEALADNGNGNYAYIDTISEARKVLVEEAGGTLFTVAKDVKLQVDFNPAWIKGYRLLGYENRLMAAEDFSDDTKDGGEIGAGHRVTALYEIVPADSAFEIAETGSKYAESASHSLDDKASSSREWLTLNIRYKDPDGENSKLQSYPVGSERVKDSMSLNMSWAAGVAQAGMLLKGSEYAGTSSYSEVYSRLAALPGVTEDSSRMEFLYLLGQMG